MEIANFYGLVDAEVMIFFGQNDDLRNAIVTVRYQRCRAKIIVLCEDCDDILGGKGCLVLIAL